MKLDIFSFGYKHGLPDADTVFDVRFLPNPYYVNELKDKTGLVDVVAGYVLNNITAQEFFDLLKPLLLKLIRSHEVAGREKFRIGIGCTGGKHRSVAVVEYLQQFLHDHTMAVEVSHRDILKE